MSIVTIGDNCIDYYTALKNPYPGGNAVNVAVYAKRYGIASSYVGVVGMDEFGEQMIEAIQSKDVDVSHLHTKEGKTAVTYVDLDGNERVFTGYDEGVMANFSLSDHDISFIKNHKIVHSGISGHCEDYFEDFKQSGMVTSFDFSDDMMDSDNTFLSKLIPFVDYAFFSYEKDDSFIRDFLIDAHSKGCTLPIATLGGDGSLAYDGNGFYKHGIKKVDVIDSMGAGDSFIAGFLVGILHNDPIEKCFEIGTQNAAKTIAYYGAW